MIFRSKSLMLAIAAVCIVTATASIGCKKPAPPAPQIAVDPFPSTGVVSGWEKSSDTRIFAPKDLWQYIDGGADAYVAAGVVTTSTSDYTKDQLESTVDIFTMGDEAGARKMLETGLTPDVKNIQLGDAGIAYAQSIVFRKGAKLVRIVGYEDKPGTETQASLLALAHSIEAKL